MDLISNCTNSKVQKATRLDAAGDQVYQLSEGVKSLGVA